ncbi:MAG: hypothetical protein AAGC93_28855 [Cyanobacteria bacterium P01_F01_bin.53]
MTRLSRHTSRVKPPLRGRTATQHYRGEYAPIASIRRPLPSPRPTMQSSKSKEYPISPPDSKRDIPDSSPKETDPSQTNKRNLYAKLTEFYQKLGEFFSQHWKWLIVLVVLAAILIGIASF